MVVSQTTQCARFSGIPGHLSRRASRSGGYTKYGRQLSQGVQEGTSRIPYEIQRWYPRFLVNKHSKKEWCILCEQASRAPPTTTLDVF